MWRLQVVSGPALAPIGTLAAGQATVTGMGSTAGILAGSQVFAPGCLLPDTLVLSVDSATQITLTQPACGSGSGVALTVGNEPVTLAQAKAHALVERPDQDARVASMIAAARRTVETIAGQQLIATTMDYWGDNWPWLGGYYNRVVRAMAVMGPMPYYLPNSNTGVLQLEAAPLLSVAYVRYQDFAGDWVTLDPSQYLYEAATPGSVLVGPSRIQPQYGMTWPVPRPTIDCVNIRFSVGYGADFSAVPENLKHAILMLVAHWYENRESVIVGTISSQLEDTIGLLLSASDHGAYS
jgi:hypothetical protein